MVNPWMGRALRDEGPEVRGRILSARRQLERGKRPRRLAITAFAVLLVLMGIREIRRGEPWWWYQYSFAAGIVGQLGMIVVFWWPGLGNTWPEIRRAALGHDLCPSCGGDLAGVESDSESGRVRCPGCAAEWYRHARLSQKECGACGYDLSGLAAGEGGVVRCPECGVGWRVGGE